MGKMIGTVIGTVCFFLLNVAHVSAHCEVPCGIYDDEMRINMLYEHIATIDKAMIQIKALEKEHPASGNQYVRWVANKEKHADEFQRIVSQYFLTQRIKPDALNYERKLVLLHQMLLFSMKCKQTVLLGNAEKLKFLVDEFRNLYFEAH